MGEIVSDEIFIAWGGNQGLANAVAGELHARGFTARVGGVDTDPLDDDYFLGPKIFRQLRRASRAIILAQRSEAGADLRPNLVFEWGYLTSNLLPGYMHVFLIDIRRTELPSDLQGLWCSEIGLTDERTTARNIAQGFLASLRQASADGREVFEHWHDRYRAWLQDQVDGRVARDGLRLAAVFVHSIQPAFHSGDLALLAKLASDIRSQSPQELLFASVLVRNVITYYDITDKPAPKVVDLIAVREALDDYPAWLNPQEPLHRWLDIVRTDFLGLARFKLALVTHTPPRTSDLRVALETFERCLSTLDACPSGDREDRLWVLWRGYVLRNKGRVQHRLGDPEAKDTLREAHRFRRQAVAYFRGLLPPTVAAELAMESVLVGLDLAQIVETADAGEMLDEVEQVLLDKGVSRGAALWRRACAQYRELARTTGRTIPPGLETV